MDKQLWSAIIVVVVAQVVGLFYQTNHLDKRIDDLRSEMSHRFDDLKDWIRAELRRIDERIDRLEHPLTRP